MAPQSSRARSSTPRPCNLVLIDPPGFRFAHFLFDTAHFIKGAIEECGHPCSVRRNELEPGALNVIVGAHLVPDERWVERIIASELDYVVIQTEILTGRDFNHEGASRVDRVFVPLAREAVGIWEPSEKNLSSLDALGLSADLLRFGYVESVSELPSTARRDIDFFFCGSVTTRRRKVLEELARLGYKVEVRFDDQAFFRNDLMARSEIVVTLRQSDDMDHVPAARILYAANNGCLVVGDAGTEGQQVDDLFWHTKEDDIVEFLRRARSHADRDVLRKTYRERLRARPMKTFVAPILARAMSTASARAA